MIDLLKKPVLFEDVIYSSDDDIHYLYHQSEKKVLLLENAVAVEIVKLCDGKNSIEDITLCIENEFSDSSRDVIEADLIEMLLFLESENLINF